MNNIIFNKENINSFFIMLAVVSIGYLVMHHDAPKNTDNNTIHEANFSEIHYIEEDNNTINNISK